MFEALLDFFPEIFEQVQLSLVFFPDQTSNCSRSSNMVLFLSLFLMILLSVHPFFPLCAMATSSSLIS